MLRFLLRLLAILEKVLGSLAAFLLHMLQVALNLQHRLHVGILSNLFCVALKELLLGFEHLLAHLGRFRVLVEILCELVVVGEGAEAVGVFVGVKHGCTAE